MEDYIIGIDLGTTFSCVSVYKNGKLEIIDSDFGSKTLPSYVAFTDEGILVGEAALRQALITPENTVYGIKRLIGRRYNDPSIKYSLEQLPFKVLPFKEYCKIQVTYKGDEKTFTTEEISAMIVGKIKETAEAYLGVPVTKAVLTVPAYFNDSQRQSTINAGNLAGLKVLRIMNEPTAAAIAYGTEKPDMTGTFLVFDLGGGTLDVSIVSIEDTRYVIRSTSGKTNFGGQDITNNIVVYLAELFQKKHNISVMSNKRALARLRAECENTKKSLSAIQTVDIHIDNLVDGISLTETLTRPKFNSINDNFFKEAMDPVKDALESARLTVSEIKKVIMVGGSSRIPKLKAILKDYFGGKEVYMSINPDEAVAYGAGIQGAVLNGIEIKNRNNFLIQDVTPMSLCTNIVNGVSVIIPRNSVLPVSNFKIYKTIIENQTVMHCDVYEGESLEADTFLGRASLVNIPKAPAGEQKCKLIFSVDVNGVLNVSATLLSTGDTHEIVIDRSMFATMGELEGKSDTMH